MTNDEFEALALLGLHESGVKFDSDKPRVGLVMRGFSRALLEVSKVGTFGAHKYTPSGWIKVSNGIERYDDALFRHLLEEQLTPVDVESMLTHKAHAAWNALAELELFLREKEIANVSTNT